MSSSKRSTRRGWRLSSDAKKRRAPHSVVARAAFEITVPTIAHAALGGEIEQLRGITENVIVGSNIPIGSGTVDLYMQVSKKK